VAFGESLGWMQGVGGEYQLLDVHGAGSQRSDPKSGDASRYPHGRGPQGDVIRILNFVRPVRGGQAAPKSDGPPVEMPSAERNGPPEGGRPESGMGPERGPAPGGVPGPPAGPQRPRR
jgi:hypothetical protein